MRGFVAVGSVYIGAFVLFQTLRQWWRLGEIPIASLTNQSRSHARKLVEDTVGLGLIAWVVFMILYVRNPDWWRGLPHLAYGRGIANVAAVLALLASAVLLTTGNLTMGESWRMGITDRPQPLVRHGIYRYVRHPIYGGMLLYLGSAILLMPNLLTIPAMLLAMFSLVCEAALEEDYWTEHAPGAYAAMMAETDRFFPWSAPLRMLRRSGPRAPAVEG
ncbi:MAG: hypothetical protein HY303_12825 [Candidatus Wallbacteria bacterium]|nr:hypothetical protein [Candidatus Wallbacteria bacterium]